MRKVNTTEKAGDNRKINAVNEAGLHGLLQAYVSDALLGHWQGDSGASLTLARNLSLTISVVNMATT